MVVPVPTALTQHSQICLGVISNSFISIQVQDSPCQGTRSSESPLWERYQRRLDSVSLLLGAERPHAEAGIERDLSLNSRHDRLTFGTTVAILSLLMSRKRIGII